jgi:hypothetical protein
MTSKSAIAELRHEKRALKDVLETKCARIIEEGPNNNYTLDYYDEIMRRNHI